MSWFRKIRKNLKKNTSVDFDPLKSKLMTSFEPDKVVFLPAINSEKISGHITKIVEPFVDDIFDLHSYEMLIVTAIMAWNLCVLELDGLKEETLQTMVEFKKVMGRDSFHYYKEILCVLKERKAKFFPDNRRFIVDYHVSESDNDFNLSIASTPDPVEFEKKRHLYKTAIRKQEGKKP